jgi:hypothetical protein
MSSDADWPWLASDFFMFSFWKFGRRVESPGMQQSYGELYRFVSGRNYPDEADKSETYLAKPPHIILDYPKMLLRRCSD